MLNFQIPVEQLKTCMGYPMRIIPAKSTQENLKYLKLSTEGNELELVGSNIMITIISNNQIKTTETGSVIVPAKLFSSLISNINTGIISIEQDSENKLKVSRGNLKAEIAYLKSTEYIDLPDFFKNSPPLLKLKLTELSNCIKQVIYAADLADKGGRNLDALHIEKSDNYICFASTDGIKMAESKIQPSFEVENFEVNIPSRSANEIIRIPGNDTTEISIILTDGKVAFKTDSITIISQTKNTKFPAYKQFMYPKNITTTIHCLKDELVDLIKTSSAFADEIPRITIDAHDDIVSVASDESEIGSFFNSVHAQIEGEPIKFGISYSNMLESIANISTDTVEISTINPKSPIYINGLNDDMYKSIIMPMV